MPTYQSSAVGAYYANHAPAYTAAQYNNSMKVRGYPDISANGANYVVYVNGSQAMVYGIWRDQRDGSDLYSLTVR